MSRRCWPRTRGGRARLEAHSLGGLVNVRRIAGILLLDGALDAHYPQAVRETRDWQASVAANDPVRGWQRAMPGFGTG